MDVKFDEIFDTSNFQQPYPQYLYSILIIMIKYSSGGAVLVNTISSLTTRPLDVIFSQFNPRYLEQSSTSGTFWS